MRWINFDNLPHIGKKIHWAKCVGLNTDFIYDNIQGEILFLNCESSKRKVRIYIDGYTPKEGVNISTRGLYSCKLDMIIKKSYIFLYNIGDVVNNLQILTQYYDTNTKRKTYQYKCLNDGYIGTIKEIHLRYGHGCPVCSNTKIIKGINDLNTTNPKLSNMLHNHNDGYKYTEQSNKQLDWNCPNCGKLIKNIPISRVRNNGLSCKFCSDGISYPNKFMSNLLNQLGIQFINEFRPAWAQGRSYDFYIPDKNIIIEMDGSFHYNTSGYYDSIDSTVKIDIFKNRIANEHGIKVIRIKCHYIYVKDRYDIIKSNTIKMLSLYYDLSNIDFDEINRISQKSYVMKSVEMYNNGIEINTIAKHLRIHSNTVRNYLSECAKDGLCDYKTRIKAQPIMCVQTNQYFANQSICSKLSETLFGFKIPRGSMTYNIQNNKEYRGLLFKIITHEYFNQKKKESPELCFGDSFLL